MIGFHSIQQEHNKIAPTVKTREPHELYFDELPWLQLNYLMQNRDTEIGCWAITADPDEPFRITGLFFPKQYCSAAWVEFDDEATAEYAEWLLDQGLALWQGFRIWIHTHPAISASPSAQDRTTFKALTKDANYGVMFILAKGGEIHCELNVRPEGMPRIRCNTQVKVNVPTWWGALKALYDNTVSLNEKGEITEGPVVIPVHEWEALTPYFRPTRENPNNKHYTHHRSSGKAGVFVYRNGELVSRERAEAIDKAAREKDLDNRGIFNFRESGRNRDWNENGFQVEGGILQGPDHTATDTTKIKIEGDDRLATAEVLVPKARRKDPIPTKPDVIVGDQWLRNMCRAERAGGSADDNVAYYYKIVPVRQRQIMLDVLIMAERWATIQKIDPEYVEYATAHVDASASKGNLK